MTLLNNRHALYLWAAIFAALLFGLSTPLSKLLLESISPLMLAGLYYFGAACFLTPFAYREFAREVRYLRRAPRDCGRLFGAIFFGGIVGPVLLLLGIERTMATTASLLLNCESVATFLFGWWIFKEHVNRRVVLASIFIVAGGILLVFDGQGWSLDWGALLVVAACVAWGLDNNFTATVEGVSARTNTIIKGIVAGSVNIGLALLTTPQKLTSLPIPLLSAALVVGALSYGLSIALYIFSARNLGAIRSQLIFSINPFLGALLSFLFFRDLLTPQFYGASVLMVLAIVLLNREQHEHDHEHLAQEHEHEHDHQDGHHAHIHPGEVVGRHSHRHHHTHLVHSHHHYPDLHHRHEH